MIGQINAGLALAGANPTNSAVTTVGAATLTAAQINGGIITRSGSVAAYTDTTDTAANIIAGIPGAGVGTAYLMEINNTVGFTETLAAGTGVTLAGLTSLPPGSTGLFLVSVTSATAVTMTGIGVSSNVSLPPAQYVTAALTAGTIPAASIVGADFCVWKNTGTTPGAQTFPTAATLYAAIPGAYVGLTTLFRVVNTGSGTLTLTADAGATVTIVGSHAAVLTNTFVDYTLQFTTATAATVTSVGAGTSP